MAVLAINSEDIEFISAATFLFPDEAEVARALLRSADIHCYLENEHTLAKVWQWNVALGGLRLMVPAPLLEEVHAILDETLSEEDQTAVAGIEPWPNYLKRCQSVYSLQAGGEHVRARCS
jgi:hypothetical protein